MLIFALGKAVGETHRYPEFMLAGILPVRPDRQYILVYQAFYIWWFFSIMQVQKIMTEIIGNCIIHLINIFSIFPDNHVPSNNGAKVVKN